MAQDNRPERDVSRRSLAREERRKRSEAKKTRRRGINIAISGVIGALVLVGLFVPQLGNLNVAQPRVDSTPTPNRAAGIRAEPQDSPIIAVGDPHAGYSTTPPTSGPHYEELAPWGIHDAPVADEHVVRNLEVGGIAISYNLGDEATVERLEQFTRSQASYPGCFVMRPYDALPEGTIALSAWGWYQTFTSVDVDAKQTFVTGHLNQAPEFLGDRCGYTPPTPTPAPTNTPAATPTTATPTPGS